MLSESVPALELPPAAPEDLAPDSPSALLAVLALLLGVDGKVHAAELALIEQVGLPQRLGLGMDAITEGILAMQPHAQALCPQGGQPDMALWRRWLGCIKDPSLQRVALSVGFAAGLADGVLSRVESKLLMAAGGQWQQEPEALLVARPELGLGLLDRRRPASREQVQPRWVLPG